MVTKHPYRRAPAPATSPPPTSDSTDRHLSDRLTDSLGFLIVDSGRYVKRSLYARIANHGIRGGAWFVLRVLWQRDGLTQRELAGRLGLMEPSVQEMLRAMERERLLVLRYAEIEIIDMAALVTKAGTIDPALLQTIDFMASTRAKPVAPESDQPL